MERGIIPGTLAVTTVTFVDNRTSSVGIDGANPAASTGSRSTAY